MTIVVDPAGNEVKSLASLTKSQIRFSWQGRHVLEIGCGDGRLTLRLARLDAWVQGIDPDAKLIRLARKKLPKRYAACVSYRTARAEAQSYPDASFDLVVFAWAL